MAVITRRQATRNNVTAIQSTILAATSSRVVTSFRAVGGTTIGCTGTLDTDAYMPYDIDDKIGFIVSWAASNITDAVAAMKLTVNHGTARRGWQKDIGSFSFYPQGTSSGSSGNMSAKRWLVGPFETARFARETTAGSTAARGTGEGRNHIHFTLASASSANSTQIGQAGRVNILGFRFPTVTYSS